MLLPAAQERGEIHFFIAKRLPYGWRLIIAFALMVAGLALQILDAMHLAGMPPALAGKGFPVGLALVLAGVLMLLTKGYRNILPQGKPENWQPVHRGEIERILVISQEQRAWDHDILDITCLRGLLAFVVIIAMLSLVPLVWRLVSGGMIPFGYGRPESTGFLLLVNAAVMLLPFWVTGARFILKNDRLVVKSKMLLGIEDTFNRLGKAGGEEFAYQMQTVPAKDGQTRAPFDIKAVLQFHDGPPEFLGMQMQISINSVQGSDYPYFYCVLVAKHEGLAGNHSRPTSRMRGDWPGRPPRGITVEFEQQTDTDIAVIRQETTRNSGYHTNQRAAAALFAYALQQARYVTAPSKG